MVENNSDLQRLFNSLICFNREYRLAICHPCGFVFPKDIPRHLRDHYNISSKREQRAIVEYINTLNIRSPKNVMKDLSLELEIDAIEGLTIHTLVRCKTCQLLGAESTIMKHCQTTHNWTSIQSTFSIYFANHCSNVDYADRTNISTKAYQILSSMKDRFKLHC